ncbi:von Willebrand factor D and EGF domain-containing protein isoform X2 [Patella vulgata]|uniref:von Willebrand factor D and EGF domain-containing protein isoform X2 n=1 Tax=Patella vulgata TaxID=6465 RepID=UPI00218035F6|nr:von Willebrand factor D and EGF domain-containing protein isoform X2 [Patella vulgata]
MTRKNGVRFLVLLSTVYILGGQSREIDPCLTYSNLSDPLRSTFQQPRQTDTLLCDRYLVQGWYRFLDGLIPTTCIEPFRCGTQAPIWMNGTIPSPRDGIVKRNTCVNARSGTDFAGTCCSITIPIDVRNCGEFVIYNLRNTPGCPMSYCVESPPQLPSAPRLIGPEIIGNLFRFACTISFPAGASDVAFDITWSFDGQPFNGVPATSITGDDRVSYLDQEHWKGNVGKTLRCHVRAFHTSMPSVKGSFIESDGYWGGMMVSPNTISVSESGDEQTVNVTCTLPVLCHHKRECAIHLTMDVQRGSWEDIVAVRDCRLKLNRDDWNPVKRSAMTVTSIMATRDFVDDGDQQLLLNFNPDFSAASDIWQGYSFPGVKVMTLDGITSRCYAFSDPHIRGLERIGVYHLYEEGDYIFLRNKRRAFEIHIRSWPCVGRGCICAVVIREGNDVISVDVCDNTDGNTPAKLRVLSGQDVAQGTKIQRSRDGQTFMITFESGNWLRVKDFRAYLNVEVQATSRDYGALEGICGTFDNNKRNEFISPNGMIFADSDIPVDFMRSWRIPTEQSLFTGQFQRIATTTLSRPVLQPYQCMCKTSSNLAECATAKAIQDPNTLTITNYMDITIAVTTESHDVKTEVPSTRGNGREFLNVMGGGLPTVSLTESDARVICRNSIINITLGVDCATTLNLHLDGFISSCVQDTMLTGNDFFVRGMVAAFEVACQEAILRNISSYKQDGIGRRVPPEAVTTLMCPNQCSLRGRCGDGICRCNPGYAGDDCSVESSRPPKVIYINGYGICDVDQRPCGVAILIVDNFMETPDTICQLREVEEVNSVHRPQGIRVTVPVEFQSNREVICHLLDSQVSKDVSVRRYFLSVSTDGQRFSNEVIYTVYDSTCHRCTRNGTCSLKAETCLIGDKCWQMNQPNPLNANQICDPSVNSMDWTLKVTTESPTSPTTTSVVYIPALVYSTVIVPTTSEVPSTTQSTGTVLSTTAVPKLTNTTTLPYLVQSDEIPESAQQPVDKCNYKNIIKYYDRWDIWTSNRTGCPCDSSDSIGECACCEVGACRCLSPNANQCTRCGEEEAGCNKRLVSPEFGIDGWTKSLDGCQCPYNQFRYNCACCQNGACHCGERNINQCAPCWNTGVCGSKPDVFGTS